MPGETNEVNWRGVRPVSGIRGVWPAIDSVRVNANAFHAGAGTTIIYTVPANKKLFIFSLFLAAWIDIDAIASASVLVRDDLDAEQYRCIHLGFQIKGQLVTPMYYSPALEADAGWDVVIVGIHANIKSRGMFSGWLEDA